MARSKNTSPDPATTAPNETLSKITSWDRTKNPPFEELFEWLNHILSQIVPYREHIYAQRKRMPDHKSIKELYTKGRITKGDYIHYRRMVNAFPLVLDFEDAIEGAADALNNSDEKSDVFVQGVRIGLLHEKFQSVIDGRYQAMWLANEMRSTGGKATTELTSDQHVFLLKTTYDKYSGQTKEFQKIANELYDRHGIRSKRGKKISAKTIERRIKQLLDSDNA